VRNESDRYNLQAIPIRPGSTELYVRLEFYDGTRSDVRPAQMPNAPLVCPRLPSRLAGESVALSP
jgi:hypothetical protein